MVKHPIHDPARFEPEPKPKGRPRTGLSKVLLPALVFFAMLFGALAITEAPISFPRWMTADIEEGINDRVGQGLFRLGDIEFRIEDGWPRVTMRNVELSDASGARLGQLNAVRAKLSPDGLLAGQLLPRELRVSGAQMTVRRTLDGQFSLSFGGAGGTEGDLASILDAIDQTFQNAPFDAVSLVEAEDLTITLEDARTGRLWQATDGSLRLENAQDRVSITVVSEVFNGTEDLARIQLSFLSPKADAGVSVGVTMEAVAARDIAAQAPALAFFDVLDAPIDGALRATVAADGSVETMAGSLEIGAGALQPDAMTRPIAFDEARAFFQFDPDDQRLTFSELSVKTDILTAIAQGQAYLRDFRGGWPSSLVTQLQFTEIDVDPAGLLPAPVGLDGVSADFRLRLDPFGVDVGQVLVRDGPQRYHASGRVQAEPEGWRGSLDLSVPEIGPERLFQLWPVGVIPETRAWLQENIHEARFRTLEVSVRTDPAGEADVGLSFGYDQTRMTVLPEFPPVENGAGLATMFNDIFTISIEKGTLDPGAGGLLSFAGTTVQITDTTQRPPPARVEIQTEGTLEATLAAMNNEPFAVLEKSGRSADVADGLAKVDGVIEFILDTPVKLETVDYLIGGSIENVRSDVIVPDRLVLADRLDARITPEGLTLNGPGTLDGLPFDVSWWQPFGDAADNGSLLTGVVELSQRFLDTFDIGLPPGTVNGEGRADVAISIPVDGEPELKLTSTMEDVALAIAPLGWRKPATVAASLTVEGILSEPADIRSIVIDAPDFSAAGSVKLDGNGDFESASFEDVTSGSWFESDVLLVGRGRNVAPGVVLTDGRIDTRDIPDVEASPDASPIDATLNELVISDGISLRPFQARTRGGAALAGTFTGRVNGGAPVRGSMVPTATGTAYRIVGDDAGQIFRSAGVFEQLASGTFDMILRPFAGSEGYDGQLDIRDAQLRDQPALAALLDAISVVGILDELQGPGIAFNTIDARFRITSDRVIIDQGAAVGGSLGLSLDGYYNLETRQLDMQGVISPIYLLNGIGQIFTRRGEGLFGFAFRMTGSADAPRISVNPLSILTPGMFREIFRRPPPDRAETN